MRVILITCGILIIGAGVWCLGNPGASFKSMAFILGIVLSFNGIAQFISYFLGRKSVEGTKSSWVAVESLITLALGMLVLGNQMAAEIAIPLVFGMWVMVSGVLRVIAATQMNYNEKKSKFWATLIIGVVLFGTGIYSFLNPLFAAFSVVVLVGIIFFAQGIAAIELGINMPHDKR
ncbi:MAG: HdeD family acid-resistance protein [Anaerovoracaceae bacterium]